MNALIQFYITSILFSFSVSLHEAFSNTVQQRNLMWSLLFYASPSRQQRLNHCCRQFHLAPAATRLTKYWNSNFVQSGTSMWIKSN